MQVADREGAIPYDVTGVEFGHNGRECSFDALAKKHQLDRNPGIGPRLSTEPTLITHSGTNRSRPA
jgi:hypothetical protein